MGLRTISTYGWFPDPEDMVDITRIDLLAPPFLLGSRLPAPTPAPTPSGGGGGIIGGPIVSRWPQQKPKPKPQPRRFVHQGLAVIEILPCSTYAWESAWSARFLAEFRGRLSLSAKQMRKDEAMQLSHEAARRRAIELQDALDFRDIDEISQLSKLSEDRGSR